MIYDESALNVAEYNLNISRRKAWDLQCYVGAGILRFSVRPDHQYDLEIVVIVIIVAITFSSQGRHL